MIELVNDFFGIRENIPTTFGEFIPYVIGIFVALMLTISVFRMISFIVQAVVGARRIGK